MSSAEIPTGRGWYPDPFSKGESLRLFDGARWTDKTRPIPADYDVKKQVAAQTAPKAATNPKEQPASSPAAPEPKAPKEAPKKPQPASPFANPAPKQAKPAKNGTAPMFATPTVTALKEDETNSPKKPAAAKPAGAPPAFASPTVTALKEDETSAPKKPDAPATPSTPTIEPAAKAPPKPLFAKPVAKASTEPAAQSFGAPSEGTKAPAFSENSATVTEAFAKPAAKTHHEPKTAQKRTIPKPKVPKVNLPHVGGLRELASKYKAVNWAVTVVLGVSVVVAPMVVPSPTKEVAAECRPISKVVVAYDEAEDFSVTPEVQANLAAAVSTGQLTAATAALVSDAVENNDLQPLIEQCIPQEVE